MKGFSDWTNSSKREQDEKTLRKIWDRTSSYKGGYTPDVEAGHEAFMKRIGANSSKSAVVVPMRTTRFWLQAAAAIALLLVAGFVLNHFVGSPANMKSLVASSSEILEQTLHDGTKVSLNGGSSLQLPDKFDKNQRVAQLKGEAFFEVVKDTQRPFRVETDKGAIEVLGTSFNVRAFPQEDFIEVFVKSGTVAVQLKGLEKPHILTGGQLLRMDADDQAPKIRKNESDINALAWKNGLFDFKKQNMGDILETIGKHYKTSFDLLDPKLKTCPFTTKLSTSDLKSALQKLEKSCRLQFVQKGSNHYEVVGGCCE